MAVRSQVIGCGAYLPERVMSNSELAAQVDTSDAWISKRTGIRQRHLAADPGQNYMHLLFHWKYIERLFNFVGCCVLVDVRGKIEDITKYF